MTWLDQQIKFRWVNIPEDRALVLNQPGLDACRRIPHIGVLDLDGLRYFTPTQGGVRSKWDESAQMFVENGLPQHAGLARRQTRFANLCHDWKLRGKFATNWHDAQGWDYQQLLPELNGVPLIQFCRRRSQRGQVVLMPLAWNYMGPGGPNLPTSPDPLPFQHKADKVVWRGRCTGTARLEGTDLWWAVSSFREGRESLTEKYLPQMARWRMAHALKDSRIADVKFTLNEQELSILPKIPLLQDLMSGLVGERLTQQEQQQAKFLLVVDGNDIGSNKYWSLLSNSVTLMVESEWETALDAGLEPWVHYVPVPLEREAIEATVADLLHRPQQCEDIIRAAHALLRQQLDLPLREAADYATLHRYQQQVLCCADLPMKWSLARR